MGREREKHSKRGKDLNRERRARIRKNVLNALQNVQKSLYYKQLAVKELIILKQRVFTYMLSMHVDFS